MHKGMRLLNKFSLTKVLKSDDFSETVNISRVFFFFPFLYMGGVVKTFIVNILYFRLVDLTIRKRN